MPRPLYFMVPFWGRRYREYFVDLCLPSLLAPNNLPLLRAEDGHRFLMATTREDWEAIEGLPIMERLRAHATPTWLEIDSPTMVNGEAFAQYNAIIRHQTLCYKKLIDAGYRDHAYGCLIFPDLLYSDGMVATLLQCMEEGYHLVLCSSLRHKEEAVLEDLIERGLFSREERFSLTAQELIIPPRVMASLFIRHLHPEMWIFEETEAHLAPPRAPFRYWRVPGDRGMIMHTVQGVPILMDFKAVPEGHTRCLERDLFEYVYIGENFGQDKRIRIIQDSDEFGIVSLTPTAVSWAPPLPQQEASHSGWFQHYQRLCNIRESLWYYAGRNRDTLRRDLFRLSIRWHTGDLDDVWASEEQRIGRIIDDAVGDYYRVSRPPHEQRFPSKFSFDPRRLLLSSDTRVRLIDPWARRFHDVHTVIRVIGKRVGLALCGDKVALRWWGWRLRKLGAVVTRRPFQEPRPPVP